jgi:hypothetical protein
MTQRLLFLDFETYFDSDYSLSKMPTPCYILDPRFEVQMCAVKVDAMPSWTIDGLDFPGFLTQFDPATTTTVTFNALFDNAILAWRYGFVPSMMLDAMGMARALRGHVLDRFSLAAVAEHLGVGVKGNTLSKVKGLRRAEFSGDLYNEFSRYAKQDVDLCAAIFDKLSPEFPRAERKVMDLVLRCAIEPRFRADVAMLRLHLAEVKEVKAELLEWAAVDVETLMSVDKFKAVLEALGVEVEYKTSPTGNQIPAFAKTDQFMADLLAHPDARVQALAAARLGHKSTIEETRAEKFLAIAELDWYPDYE